MDPSDTGRDATGCLLAGRYRIVRAINAGASATVWAAVDETLGREVAIKEVSAPIHPDRPDRHSLREQTLREARAAGRVDHPGVIPVYDVVDHDGRLWIVMKLVRAPSLAELIERDGPLDPRRTARIGLRVVDALRAVHALGIVHRDVKPSNVLIEDDHVMLADFGIAAIADETTPTPADTVLGAPGYIAPECVDGEPATPAADLWALGATLYAAVEGRPPFRRDGIVATLAATVLCEPDPMLNAGSLAPLLVDLLRRDRRRRPTAAAVERRLRRVAGPGLVVATGAGRPIHRRPRSAGRGSPTRIGRIRTVSYTAAVVGLIALAHGLVLLPRGEFQELDSGPRYPNPRTPAVEVPAEHAPIVGLDPVRLADTGRPVATDRPHGSVTAGHHVEDVVEEPVGFPTAAPAPATTPPQKSASPTRPSATPPFHDPGVPEHPEGPPAGRIEPVRGR